MASETDTPRETLQAATQKNALPSGRLALLGTFLKPGGDRAIIRTSSGKIATVTKGTTIGNAKVIAIEEGRLVLLRGTNTTTLEMPRG
ncbi:MAG: hypothetical protein ACE369_19620 [Roseovarius sp.]